MPDFGSGQGFVRNVIGDLNTQYKNTFDVGRDFNKFTGNNLLINNRSGPNVWGQGQAGGRRGGRRGGSLAGIIGTALTPGLLLAAQNRYKPNRNIYSNRNSKKTKGRRRSRRRFTRYRR